MKQALDRKLTLTASVRSSLIAKIAGEARARGVSISTIVDEALEDYFENRTRSGRKVTVRQEDQDQRDGA